jgi:murein DD-endopeptidase MepM/ murein hydrolase activator NlpD
MRSRGRTGVEFPRAVLALVLGVLATIGGVRLLLGPNQPPAENPKLIDMFPGSPQVPDLERPETAQPADTAIAISLTLDRSSTVASYLENAGIDEDEAYRWARIFRKATGNRYFLRDHPLTLYKDPETGELRGFKYDLNLKASVVMASLGNMVLKAAVEPIEYYVRPVQLAFEIKDSFSRAARAHGVPRPIVESLEDAFADRHALNHLRPGSAVKLIYKEKISRDGTYHLVNGVEAAQISFGDRTLSAFSFRDEHGRQHLYDSQGRPLGPEFLRFPLKFKYISSGFTFHRYHPLLHIYRPHFGVDLVAKYGTPVQAVADGRIDQAGWCGELGKCVKIEHDRGMKSIYGHLARINPDLRRNTWVHMGEVIGWVGSTGLSTGPHLHFAIEKGHAFVNPLTQKLGANHRVSPRMKSLFNAIKDRYEHALARLPDLGSHFVAPDARKPPISKLGDRYHVSLRSQSSSAKSARHHHRRIARRHSRHVIRTAERLGAVDDGAM